jgi:glycosyltransferase involved in cell wall biosynthesis
MTDLSAPVDAPRRVVYHLNSIAMGGMEIHALELARGVARAGWQVSMILPELPVLDGMAADLAAVGITSHRVTLVGEQDKRRLAAAWLRTRDILRQSAPDVFHQHRTGPYHGKWGVLAARAAGVPVVVASEHQAAHRLRGVRRLVNGAADRQVDAFVAVSDHDYNTQLSEGGRPADRVVRIHNGIDLSRFTVLSPEAVAAGRIALGIPVDAPVIGTVARLEEQKGITYFLRSLPALAAAWPGLLVLIVGRGSLQESLQAEAVALGVGRYTRFLGFWPNVGQIMALMDVMVIPSVWEPFGLVAAEAMAVLRPVVASRVGGLPEIVIDGETGLLVPPADPAALTQAVNRLLADPALGQRLAAAGRARVECHFSLDAMTGSMVELYQRLLAARAGAREGGT